MRDFWDGLGGWSKILAALAFLFVLTLLGGGIFRLAFVNFVDNYEIGYLYDARSGSLKILTHDVTDSSGTHKVPTTGYFITWPIVQSVHSVDLRPMQVCISANARVLNCKLVKFNPAGLELFLSWHGRDDYDGGSAGNSNSGAISTRFNQILMSYAYEGTGKTYPFLEVLREIKSEEVAAAPGAERQ